MAVVAVAAAARSSRSVAQRSARDGEALLLTPSNFSDLNMQDRLNVSVGLSGSIRHAISAEGRSPSAALLEIHGYNDTTVPYHAAEQMFEALASAQIPFENFSIPDAGHVPYAALQEHADDVLGFLCARLYPPKQLG